MVGIVAMRLVTDTVLRPLDDVGRAGSLGDGELGSSSHNTRAIYAILTGEELRLTIGERPTTSRM